MHPFFQIVRSSRDPNWIHRALRVNHAGEYGAVRLYQGQMKGLRALSRDGAQLKNEHTEIQAMLNTEKRHLTHFNHLLVEYRAPPSYFLPIWHYCAYGMGYVTGRMGIKTAHICTSAVESVIINHYASQLAHLNTTEIRNQFKTVYTTIQMHKNEEQDHLTVAKNHVKLLTWKDRCIMKGISVITRLAIHISTRL